MLLTVIRQGFETASSTSVTTIHEFLKHFVPLTDLGSFIAAAKNGSKAAFRERVNFQWYRGASQIALDFRRELQEVHYLRDPSSRNPFSGRDFRFAEHGVGSDLLAPSLRQLERMRTALNLCGSLLVFSSDLLYNIRRKWNG